MVKRQHQAILRRNSQNPSGRLLFRTAFQFSFVAMFSCSVFAWFHFGYAYHGLSSWETHDSAGVPTGTATSSNLPTCKSLMQDPNSPYRSGDFLTRHTIPVSWKPRADHSRELQHSMCQLHRYSAQEARQCLAGKHINMIGDSITRYFFVELAYFLHKGHHPPRFERSINGPCQHHDEHGKEACSPKTEPNVCLEGDWLWDFELNQGKDSWQLYMQTLGSQRIFDGHMESTAVRRTNFPHEKIAENYLYASPTSFVADNKTSTDPFFLSFNSETGFGELTPIQGFSFTGCAKQGTCTYSDELFEQRFQRASNKDYDFSQPLEQAIGPNGILRNILPPVDVTLFNRGLWGPLQPERAQTLFPLLHEFSQGDKGRCFFRSTNTHYNAPMPKEQFEIRHLALGSGCGFFDLAHLVQDFVALVFKHPKPPGQAYGNMNDERETVYMDAVHFRPWVYEEINNMLLNVLCNAQ